MENVLKQLAYVSASVSAETICSVWLRFRLRLKLKNPVLVDI